MKPSKPILLCMRDEILQHCSYATSVDIAPPLFIESPTNADPMPTKPSTPTRYTWKTSCKTWLHRVETHLDRKSYWRRCKDGLKLQWETDTFLQLPRLWSSCFELPFVHSINTSGHKVLLNIFDFAYLRLFSGLELLGLVGYVSNEYVCSIRSLWREKLWPK